MRIMKWSFSALFAGTWPRRDWRGVAYEPGSADANRAGEPLADGYFACLIGLCGDLDYCAKFLGHPRWSSHSEPCGLCRAGRFVPPVLFSRCPGLRCSPIICTTNIWGMRSSCSAASSGFSVSFTWQPRHCKTSAQDPRQLHHELPEPPPPTTWRALPCQDAAQTDNVCEEARLPIKFGDWETQ